jgi:hypothetical protein
MTEDELKTELQALYDNADHLGITMYAILKGDGHPEPMKLDIDADSLPSLKELFLNSLRDNITNKDELSVLNLSSSDERTNAIYIYDLDVPEELATMDVVTQSDNIPLFDFSDSQLSRVKALLVEIGNNDSQVVLYKSMAPVNIFGRTSYFLGKHNHRLKRIEEDFMRISSGFQLLKIAGNLLVVDLASIEKSFGFHDVIKREAEAGITAIEELALLEDASLLSEMIEEVKYARKLTKVAKASPVIKASIDNNKIISFCRSFPELKGRIRFNEASDRIRLDTKVSKDLFIKLLMDDFLTSELTNYHYTSLAKDEADESEEESSN